MANNGKDIQVMSDLAKEYAELAERKENEDNRKLWSAHFSKRRTRPPLLVTYGYWNAWCQEVFGDNVLKCYDPFFRDYERRLRMRIFQGKINDNFIHEPWLFHFARIKGTWGDFLGVKFEHERPEAGGAWKFDPPIKEWSDMAKLRKPGHFIYRKETEEEHNRLLEAVSPYLAVDTSRATPLLTGQGDLGSTLANLRGLEQIMIDMYDSPKELHSLMKFIADALLETWQMVEAAGDLSLSNSYNQEMPYSEELPCPKANIYGAKLKDIWGFSAAQEFTLISPEMHEEFYLNYQIPIMEKFGHMAYGCCEDLTEKIKMLRKIKNLRQISVAPVANIKKCAEQIGTDYIISWRPNPTDAVCGKFNEESVRGVIRKGLEALKGTNFHIILKDVETVEGDVSRLWRWADMVNQELDRAGY